MSSRPVYPAMADGATKWSGFSSHRGGDVRGLRKSGVRSVVRSGDRASHHAGLDGRRKDRMTQLAFIGVDSGTFPTNSAVVTPLWHGPCPAAVLPP